MTQNLLVLPQKSISASQTPENPQIFPPHSLEAAGGVKDLKTKAECQAEAVWVRGFCMLFSYDQN